MFRIILLIMMALASTQVLARVGYNEKTVQTWSDAYFSKAMAERRFSGAVISVVQDGEVVFAKGYGYADYDKKTLIDPEITQFRIGSTTKTFTATAIAQLLDRGLIQSLDDPANLYLKRERLPSVNGQDITIRDLITHRSGFASRAFNIASDQDMELPLSDRTVQSHCPDIVRPIRDRAVYSNYTTTMLGIMVEDITGMRIDEYFDKFIFAPLNMERSILNMTPFATENLAQPYAFLPDGATQAIPHWGVNPFFAAAGAINSTAIDMAKYMIAHLDAGKSGKSSLHIKPTTFDLMHNRMAGNHPATQGFGMIFMTMNWAGKTGFGHGGDWPGFHSIMWMMPEDNAGVFISLMAENPDVPVYDSITGADYLMPDQDHPILPPLTNVGALIGFLRNFYGEDTPVHSKGRLNIEDLVGSYRHEYRAYNTVESFLDFLNGPFAVISVRKAGDDKVMINDQGPFQQIAPGVFWNASLESGVDGTFMNSAIWAFKWDEKDDRYYVTPRIAIDPFVKVGLWDNPNTYANILMVSLPILLSGLAILFWKKAGTQQACIIKLAALSLPITFIMVPVSLFLGYGESGSFLWHFLLGHYSHFIAAILFANLFLLFTITLAFFTLQSWRDHYWENGVRGTIKRIHLSLISLAAIAVLLFLWFYNFIGINLP